MSYLTGKKVLVAGASGLIGSHVVEALLEKGAHVVGTLHRSPAVVDDPRVEYRTVDLATVEGCRAAAEGCQVVVMAAADTSGAYMMRNDPVVHVTGNGVLNSYLIDASWRAGAERVLFVSTTTVYPDVDYEVQEEEGFRGDPHPIYFGVGWMKRYVEKLLAFYQQRLGLQPVILRPTNIYGPRDTFDWERSHVLPALIRRALETEGSLEVWGDGSAVRDFLYVDDFVDGLIVSLEECADGQPINMGSGEPVTIADSARAILRLCGRDAADLVFAPDKPTTIPKRVVDLTRARARLRWAPRVSFEEGLRRTIAWYRENPV